MTYSAEVQFAGYSDSSRSGPRVTFRLAEREDLAAFIGAEGKRYMLALVEIGDDEQPVPQPKPEKAKPPRMAPLCEWAVMRCKEEAFQRWVIDVAQHRYQIGFTVGMSPEQIAADFIRQISGVASRKELDTDKYAPHRMKVLIMQPYGEWLKQTQPETV